MNSTQLAYFREAADRLNFTQASEKLYISQSAISRGISALEDELGVMLFVRRNNVLSLTPGGEIIHRWLRESRAALEEAVREAKQANARPRGELRLGFVSIERPSDHDSRALAAFKQKYPGVSISIAHYPSKDILRRLEEHEMDVASMVGTGIYGDARLQYRQSEKHRRCMAVSVTHPLAGRESVSLTDFKNDVFLSVEPAASPMMTQTLRAVCTQMGFCPQIAEKTDMDEQIAALEAGDGVALVVENHRASNDPLIRFLPLREALFVSTVCVWDKLNKNPAIADYLECFTEN